MGLLLNKEQVREEIRHIQNVFLTDVVLKCLGRMYQAGDMNKFRFELDEQRTFEKIYYFEVLVAVITTDYFERNVSLKWIVSEPGLIQRNNHEEPVDSSILKRLVQKAGWIDFSDEYFVADYVTKKKDG